VSEAEPSDVEPTSRTRRAVPWLLGAVFTAAVFVLGAGFIYVGSLEVSRRVDVYGQPVALAGQSAWFRIWGRAFDSPAPLEGARVKLALQGDSGALSESSVRLSENGMGVISLPVPTDATPGEHTVDLIVEDTETQETVEQVSFDIDVRPPVEADSKADERRAEPRLHGVSEHGEGPLVIELFPPSTHVVTFLENPVYIRVTERATGHPVDAVTVKIEKTYGNLERPPVESVKTDALGLASFVVRPVSDTDWKLSVEPAEGEVSTVTATLVSASTSLRLVPRGYELVPGQRTSAEIVSRRDRDVVFVDVVADDAWIVSHQQIVTQQSPVVAFVPRGMRAPAHPRLATMIACFSPTGCDDVHARTPLVWSDSPLTPRARLRVMLGGLEERIQHAAWARSAEAYLDGGSPDDEVVSRATDFAAGRVPTTFVGAQLLIKSDDVATERLETAKEEFRTWASVLAVLLAIAGGMMIAAFVMSSSTQRRRAMQDVLVEADEIDADELAVPGKARKQQLALILEIVALAATIIVFAAGILLLMRQL